MTATKPNFIIHVMRAVQFLDDPKGSSAEQVIQLLRAHPQLLTQDKLEMHVHNALRHAVEGGLLQLKAGRYRLLSAINTYRPTKHRPCQRRSSITLRRSRSASSSVTNSESRSSSSSVSSSRSRSPRRSGRCKIRERRSPVRSLRSCSVCKGIVRRRPRRSRSPQVNRGRRTRRICRPSGRKALARDRARVSGKKRSRLQERQPIRRPNVTTYYTGRLRSSSSEMTECSEI
ncbi:serine-arginine protein 55-like [Periplaneta americana]|uniref:serine-arginine protein 55-like n=1 Tax=Periplaneta americana TaxID=6978 RepID=UPI0037E99759